MPHAHSGPSGVVFHADASPFITQHPPPAHSGTNDYHRHRRRNDAGGAAMTVVWIGLGAAIGANLRYLVGRLMADWLGAGFPWGTLAINVTGSFLIGVIATLLGERLTVGPEWRLVLVVGVLGGYTTFSSFSLEAVVLFEAGRWLAGIAYILGSVLLGVAACVLGIMLVRSDLFG